MAMSQLSLYNTTSNTWTYVTTLGIPPSSRASFSAVLTSDGRIIIFGGFDGTNHGDLWILNTSISKGTFQWSKGNISNPIEDLALAGHTATLVDNYMLVSFGQFGNLSYSSKIFMLDVSQKDSYKWVNEFAAKTTTTTPNTIATNTPTTNFLVGAIVGSIVSFIFVSAIFYFLMKRLNLVILFS
ncbi:hypothetical protein C2G38_1250650 [Gigaspora rosea]|uniref:Galactose oxidase n=1 Tax=Gigaspora rosea TaxID=44941 RepID=A0A397W9J2_9GLOM|nr:hypothetical protein C2G38_1250650 [Gigaspora rosea]